MPDGASADGGPDVRQYARELLETLRRREPQAYRELVERWRDLFPRGTAERLLGMDDAALRQRMERMREEQQGGRGAPPAGGAGTVRLRRRKRASGAPGGEGEPPAPGAEPPAP